MTHSVNNFSGKIRWLIFCRLLSAVFIMGGTIVYRANENLPYLSEPFVYIYWLTGWILFLSLCYALIFEYFKNDTAFAWVQIVLDTMIVSVIVYVTGCFSSIFTFLYLIVIICASMLLSRKGSLIIAALCSMQYGLLTDLSYYGIINAGWFADSSDLYSYEWNQIVYKILAVMSACFITAILSSYLAEQERRAQTELTMMEGYLKRVENMAVVGEMAAGLAHEIKNPIASLSGSVQLLGESGEYNDVQNKLIRIVVRESERLNSLVTEFLMFARPKKGSPEPVRVDRVLNEMIEQCRMDEVFLSRIEFITNIQEDLWTEMDAGHLRQVVLNLLLNAAEAIPGPGGIIAVQAYSLKSGFLRIKVGDNGSGIDQENLHTIFEPFFTTKTKGTGLGLSIVYRLLEAYGYQIDVKSEKTQGTEFILKLKLVKPVSYDKADKNG